ncbi:MAG: 1-acylglycerol-3-phosphate O-acyltransferase abhd5 [Marteilia pararefringens]
MLSPAVFIHGLYPGVFLWSNLMDKVSQNRISYYIDLPGFANSTKTVFSESGDVNESAIVNFIEEWRKNLQLEDFSIIAHSFGCYFSFAYCLRFPQFVKKFILIDPWGIYSLNMNKHELNNSDWSKLANPQYFTSKFFSPLAIMRHTGKIMHVLSNAFRQDLIKNFKYLPKQTFYDYLEYSSSNDVATGERLFDSVQNNVYFASHPMIERAGKLDTNIELYCLISKNSFIRDFHKNFDIQMKQVLGERLKGFEILIDVDDKIITNPKFADHLSSKILC